MVYRVMVCFNWKGLTGSTVSFRRMLHAYVEQNPLVSVTYIISGVAGTQDHRVCEFLTKLCVLVADPGCYKCFRNWV